MENGIEKVRVWDPLIRIFHWTLVAAFTIAYFTDDEDLLLPHVWAGYVVVGLLVFRFLWGFVGSAHARFADFVSSPAAVVSFLRDTLQGEGKRYLGHNPAGGWMIILLLVMLSLLSVTGLVLYGADEHAGPLAGLMAGAGPQVVDALEESHEFFANLTVFLVIIHLAGVAVESILHRENLVRAMVSGYKRAENAQTPVASRSLGKAASLLGGLVAVGLAIFALGVVGGGGEVNADPPQREILQQDLNDLQPLEHCINKAESEHSGRLIEAELKIINGRSIYEIEILDDSGRVWESFYDAETGEPLHNIQEEDK
jgi:cytochrome b/uncharacterized membrane protein YkoI